MEKNKNILDGIISDYYNSVNEMFFYRIKNNWKIESSSFLFFISVVFTIFNVIPLLPLNDNYFLFLFEFIKKNFDVPFKEYNFWIKWGLGSLTSSLISLILYIPYKYWDIRDTKKALRNKYLPFCYVYTLRKEIKSYLINDNLAHLENTVEYFNNVMKTMTIYNAETGSKGFFVNLVKLRTELKNQFSWIDFSADSNQIIDSFLKIESRITRRLKQKIELEKILPLIDLITLYEFSKIKPDELNQNGIQLSNCRDGFLIEFAKEINSLDEIENLNDLDKNTIHKIKLASLTIANLFISSNILVLFLSWLVLLSILFIMLTMILITSIKLNIDSTIFIGILTAPFLGAITLAATIYNKHNK